MIQLPRHYLRHILSIETRADTRQRRAEVRDNLHLWCLSGRHRNLFKDHLFIFASYHPSYIRDNPLGVTKVHIHVMHTSHHIRSMPFRVIVAKSLGSSAETRW
jgi:hypothetical protein